MNNSYVYVYLDPRKPGQFLYEKYTFNFEPFYIGVGQNKRIYDHLAESYNKNESKQSRNKLKCNKIRKIKRETNKDPIIFKLKEDISLEEALLIENILIISIGRIDLHTGPLTNLTNGGIGSKGRILSDETKKKISQKKMGSIPWNKGLTAETNAIVAQYVKNRPPTFSYSSPEVLENFKENRRRYMKGRYLGKDNPSWKFIDETKFILMWTDGKTYDEIRNEFHIGYDAISLRVKNLNLKPRCQKIDKQLVLCLFDQKHTIPQIEKITKYSRGSIQRLIKNERQQAPKIS